MSSDPHDLDLSSNGHNQAEKRAHHNALERKRRDHIKGSFGDLRDVIPLLKSEKVIFVRSFDRHFFVLQASRAHILKSATEYIRTMKPKNQQRRKAAADLKRDNARLELQSMKTFRRSPFDRRLVISVHLLERMKETGLYTENHGQLTKIEPSVPTDGIQTTRNLLTYSTI